MTPRDERVRWRLIFGVEANGPCGGLGGDATAAGRDAALEFLYGRAAQGRNRRARGEDQGEGPRAGGLEESRLSVPEWINQVHTLFPRRTVERLEKDALERYQIKELVTNVEVLQRAEPNMTLLKAVLHTKHLMNQEVLAAARALVRRVVEELMKRLARPVQTPFAGSLDRRRRSFVRVAKNFDACTTIRRNLRHYDRNSERLFIQTPYFMSRVRRHSDRWQIIVVVDESGSMASSVIHAAVTAAIFWGLAAVRTHLVLFDTNVVDVTADCSDPVETIMKVQLGGGTDIGQAVRYAAGLIENPRRTIVVLITDFCEGAPVERLFAACRQLIEQGTTLLGLAALDEEAEPCYDRHVAGEIARMGAHVGAMTPGELAQFVAEKVG